MSIQLTPAGSPKDENFYSNPEAAPDGTVNGDVNVAKPLSGTLAVADTCIRVYTRLNLARVKWMKNSITADREDKAIQDWWDRQSNDNISHSYYR